MGFEPPKVNNRCREEFRGHIGRMPGRSLQAIEALGEALGLISGRYVSAQRMALRRQTLMLRRSGRKLPKSGTAMKLKRFAAALQYERKLVEKQFAVRRDFTS